MANGTNTPAPRTPRCSVNTWRTAASAPSRRPDTSWTWSTRLHAGTLGMRWWASSSQSVRPVDCATNGTRRSMPWQFEISLTVASKLACAGVRSSPTVFILGARRPQREQAPSPQARVLLQWIQSSTNVTHTFLKKNFKSRRTSGTKSAALSGYSLMVEQ